MPVTVEQARAVPWLRYNPRPLGELLDEGYLDEARLDWAAKHAYSTRLKAAAGVLLEHVYQRGASARRPPEAHEPARPPTLQVNLTVEEAKATPWPFSPYRDEPMGELSDTHRLSLKDLAYAVENAWDRKVREAAALLMAERLGQALEQRQPEAGPLNVVASGMSHSAQRERAWIAIQGMLLGAATVVLLGILVWGLAAIVRFLWDVTANHRWSIEVVIALLIGAALAALVSPLFDRSVSSVGRRVSREIESSRKGDEAERRIVEIAQQTLDSDWTLFRNVALPTQRKRKADIDIVLVGPPGIWVLEVKCLNGEYRNTGEQWEYRAGNTWKVMEKRNPTRQARNNAVHLAGFLRADGIRQWVEPAVVWANPDATPAVQNPMVAVWPYERLADELGNLQRGRKLDEATQAKVVEKLTALCVAEAERQKAEG